MDLNELARQIKEGEWSDLMSPADVMNVLKMSEAEVRDQLAASCGLNGGPIANDGWLDIYWTAGWVQMMLAAGVRPASTVMEVGSAISSNVIRAANALLGSRGRFVALNLNEALLAGFRERNRQLAIRTRFVADDALYADRRLPAASCAFVAFNHQINDIVQTIVYDLDGRCTKGGDWYAMAPHMVRLTCEAAQSGAMERDVRPRFLHLIESCCRVLAPGACMAFNNAVTPLLLRLGYDAQLLGSFVPLARRWIGESDLPLVEQPVPGFDPRWWMLLRMTQR